ncbi:transcriptional repressor [Pseudomonas sp. NY15367]
MSTQTLPSRSVSAAPDARQCREWLQAVGLRFSMPRLKVVEALASANDEQGMSARELHRQLGEAGEPLSLVSVRQVLRRMEENGLVQTTGRSRYRLSAPD